MKSTGVSTEGIRLTSDLTRVFSFFWMAIHIYLYCYPYFEQIGVTSGYIDEILVMMSNTLFFGNVFFSTGIIYLTIIISSLMMGARKKKKINVIMTILQWFVGTIMFFGSFVILNMNGLSYETKTIFYTATLLMSYLIVLRASCRIQRNINIADEDDPFNDIAESFPQQEKLIENEYSMSFKTKYKFKNKERYGYINLLNAFRGIMVLGIQGSGKTYSVIEPILKAFISKGFSICVYDWKFPDMSLVAYNYFLKYRNKYPKNTECYVINFDDPNFSHRCNPFTGNLHKISDAIEIAQTFFLNMNKSWINKQGDFFVESPVNFFAATIWYTKCKTDKVNKDLPIEEHINYCTIPHCIEIMSLPPKDVLPILAAEPEVTSLIAPFLSSLQSGAVDQLQGMLDSARIPLSRFVDKDVYYVTTENDFTLDINNPKEPKIVLFGNNPKRKETYGSFLGLYITQLAKEINQKGKVPCGVFLDELATIYIRGIDNLMATGRSNKIATVMGIQDFPQIERDYSQKVAEALISIVGNIFVGQVMFATAEKISKILGKNKQTKIGNTINSDDTSTNSSTSMAEMVPPAKLSQLSQGKMAGIVSDNNKQKNELKVFHAEIIHDDEAIAKETKEYVPLPQIREVDKEEIEQHFYKIKWEVKELIIEETELLNAS